MKPSVLMTHFLLRLDYAILAGPAWWFQFSPRWQIFCMRPGQDERFLWARARILTSFGLHFFFRKPCRSSSWVILCSASVERSSCWQHKVPRLHEQRNREFRQAWRHTLHRNTRHSKLKTFLRVLLNYSFWTVTFHEQTQPACIFTLCSAKVSLYFGGQTSALAVISRIL